MKLFLYCLMSVLVACHARLAPLLHNQNPIPKRYVIVLENDVDVPSFVHLASQRLVAPSVLRRTINRSVLKAVTVQLDDESLEMIRALPGIKHVEEDGIYGISKGANTWGQDRIDQRTGTNGYFTLNSWGEGQDIYVIDTGVRPTHQEFDNADGTESRATAIYDAINDGNGPVDCHGHGTHCCGTAAGKTLGVAAEARVFGVRVLDCRGSGSLESILDGISFVVNATLSKSVVISMSLGGSYSQTMNDLISDAVQLGDVVVAAAGNEFRDACRFSPSSEPLAITVGATEKGDRKAAYSNHGPCVDLFAPGTNVNSAWYTSDTATAALSGTSMAAPHVAGGAAVLLAQGIAPEDISQHLTSTATPDAIDLGQLSPEDTANLLLYLE